MPSWLYLVTFAKLYFSKLETSFLLCSVILIVIVWNQSIQHRSIFNFCSIWCCKTLVLILLLMCCIHHTLFFVCQLLWFMQQLYVVFLLRHQWTKCLTLVFLWWGAFKIVYNLWSCWKYNRSEFKGFSSLENLICSLVNCQVGRPFSDQRYLCNSFWSNNPL